MRSICLALLLALVASVPIEQTHSVMETLPAKKFMIQVRFDPSVGWLAIQPRWLFLFGTRVARPCYQSEDPPRAERERGGWRLKTARVRVCVCVGYTYGGRFPLRSYDSVCCLHLSDTVVADVGRVVA